jgi:hypothetical protein
MHQLFSHNEPTRKNKSEGMSSTDELRNLLLVDVNGVQRFDSQVIVASYNMEATKANDGEVAEPLIEIIRGK